MSKLYRLLPTASIFLPLILSAGHAQAGGVPVNLCEAWSNQPDAKSVYGDCSTAWGLVGGDSTFIIQSRQKVYKMGAQGQSPIEVGTITPATLTFATDAEFQQLVQNTTNQLETTKKELAAIQAASISATETRILEALQKLPPELVQKELMNSLRKEIKELVRNTVQEEVKKALENK